MVQRKSWLCDAEANEKLINGKNSTGTFKDTASAASRDRTLCLGSVVRHLYISHWSRVIGPSPPFLWLPPPPPDTSRRGAPLYFSRISLSPLSLFLPSLTLRLSVFLFPVMLPLSFLSTPYFLLFSSFSILWGRFVKQNAIHSEYSMYFHSCQPQLSCSDSWMKEITARKERDK